MSGRASARVMVVAHHEDLRECLTDLLEEWGYQVVSACSVRMAPAEFSTYGHAIQIIVLDLTVINVPYVEARPEQLSVPGWDSIPVVALGDDSEERELMLKLGAAACLMKPFTPDQLLATLARVSPAG
jgi:DNA-binding response OmpR family regulator